MLRNGRQTFSKCAGLPPTKKGTVFFIHFYTVKITFSEIFYSQHKFSQELFLTLSREQERAAPNNRKILFAQIK